MKELLDFIFNILVFESRSKKTHLLARSGPEPPVYNLYSKSLKLKDQFLLSLSLGLVHGNIYSRY